MSISFRLLSLSTKAGFFAACISIIALGSDELPHKVQIPNDLNYWQKNGFAEMVLPIHLPSNKSHSDMIRVWLKVPDDQKIKVRWITSQKRYTLVYPIGTIADRVETSRKPSDLSSSPEVISDVRGARIDQSGETFFHVYEIAPGKSERMLKGYEWPRQGAEMDKKAADVLVKLYYPRKLHWYSIDAQHWPAREIQQFRELNQCAACHQADAPSPKTTAWPFRFESDSRGFFQPIGVLQEKITIRDHREWDLNADDPFITVWCGSLITHANTTSETRTYKCPNDLAPIGILDLQSALQKNNFHALELCKSRKYLRAHKDKKALYAFRDAFHLCGLEKEIK